MPLINFTSDLTALQYGADRPGGGSSGQPYIVSPNPDRPPINTTFADYYTGNRTGLDFPIRGGVLQQAFIPGGATTPAGIIDKARIQAFLNDGSRGKIFLEKQKGLQLSNPNIQIPSVVRFAQGQVGLEEAFVVPTRLYPENGAGLLAQVGAQGTGIHFVRHGQTVQLLAPFQQTYEYFVSRNNTELANRLTILRRLKLGGSQLVRTSNGGRNVTDAALPAQLGNANKYGISPLGTQILFYPGGPGSTYGVGFTTINRATDTEIAHDRAAQFYNTLTLTYKQLAEQPKQEGWPNKWRPNIQDFRKQLPAGKVPVADYTGSATWYSPALQGDPGRVPSAVRVKYSNSTTGSNGVDALSRQLPIVYDSAKSDPWSLTVGGKPAATKDIIKFTFECLSNDNVTDTSSPAIVLVFRAFLTGMSDSNQAELNSFKYLGRGETFRTYQGFDRSISFGFKIAAQSREEMKPLYRKLNHLISQTYPDYTTNGLMRGSVIKLTIGDYLYRVPGFIESVNVTIPDESSWEIALDTNGVDSDMNQLPQMVDVQCTFKPIHNFLPRRETSVNVSTPLIGKPDWLINPFDAGS